MDGIPNEEYQEDIKKLQEYWEFFGGNLQDISDAYLIQSNLRQGFEELRSTFSRQHRQSASLFSKQTHLEQKDAQLRVAYLRTLNKRIRHFAHQFHEENKTDVIPAIHGTADNPAWKIAHAGFAITATLDDGYYGRGLSFFFKLLSFSFSFFILI